MTSRDYTTSKGLEAFGFEDSRQLSDHFYSNVEAGQFLVTEAVPLVTRVTSSSDKIEKLLLPRLQQRVKDMGDRGKMWWEEMGEFVRRPQFAHQSVDWMQSMQGVFVDEFLKVFRGVFPEEDPLTSMQQHAWVTSGTAFSYVEKGRKCQPAAVLVFASLWQDYCELYETKPAEAHLRRDNVIAICDFVDHDRDNLQSKRRAFFFSTADIVKSQHFRGYAPGLLFIDNVPDDELGRRCDVEFLVVDYMCARRATIKDCFRAGLAELLTVLGLFSIASTDMLGILCEPMTRVLTGEDPADDVVNVVMFFRAERPRPSPTLPLSACCLDPSKREERALPVLLQRRVNRKQPLFGRNKEVYDGYILDDSEEPAECTVKLVWVEDDRRERELRVLRRINGIVTEEEQAQIDARMATVPEETKQQDIFVNKDAWRKYLPTLVGSTCHPAPIWRVDPAKVDTVEGAAIKERLRRPGAEACNIPKIPEPKVVLRHFEAIVTQPRVAYGRDED